jgi:tetratricopeptide (TPR) repeat protein
MIFRLSIIALLMIIGPYISQAAAATPADSTNGARFELIVREKPALVDKYFEITRDTVEAVVGREVNVFLVNISLTLEIEGIERGSVLLTSHLTTIGNNPFNFAERYRIELNLPARIDNIPGKDGSIYQLLISPREIISIDTSLCEYDPDHERQFTLDPSANFDIYYIKGSLADYHWNNIRNYLEYEFTRFCSALDINIPGKINIYLIPCASVTVRWDSRFGYALDPARSDIYSIYNHDFSSVDAMLPNMLRLLRVWGYAPPFLVEGMAAYFDFVTYKSKKLKASGEIPALKGILTTAGYYGADPIPAEITAGSFVKFLIDTYGISRMADLYRQSDDLTLLRNIEKVYGAPLDTLEESWLHYIDTLTMTREWFDNYAARAGALFQNEVQLEYLKEMRKYDKTKRDSIDTINKLATVEYQYGDYYDAIAGFKWLIKNDSSKVLYWQILGNLYMINGEYDSALAALDSVVAIDSTFATARLLQARIAAIRGDTAAAIETAENAYPYEQSPAGKIEFLLLLGELYGNRGTFHDSVKAEKSFTDALYWSMDMIPKAAEDPAFKLRAGLAHLGLREYEAARLYLDLSRFTELRSYYLGKTLLNLGKVYDALGNHEKAVSYYQEALKIPLSTEDRRLCEKYIDQPFSP